MQALEKVHLLPKDEHIRACMNLAALELSLNIMQLDHRHAE